MESDRITTSFGAESTAAQVIEGIDLAGQRAVAGITAATGNSAVYARRLDLADQDSVEAFSAGWTGPLHLLVASSPQLEGIGGRYFEDCHEAEVIDSDATDLSEHRHGVAPYALDPGNAKHLWDVSLDLLA